MKRGDSAKRDKSGRFGKGNGMAAKPGEVRSPDGGWATKRKLAEAKQIVRERILAELERTGGAALDNVIRAMLERAAGDRGGANEAASILFDRLDGRPLSKTEHSGGLTVLEGLVLRPGDADKDQAAKGGNDAEAEERAIREARFVDDGQ